MLEDLGAIQSRISEIQGRLASLTPTSPPPAAVPESAAPTFHQTLTQAQGAAAPSSSSGGSGAPAAHAMTDVHGISVPAASLGPLPPMPVTPDTAHLVPMAATGTEHIDGLIQTYAVKHGLDPSLVRAIIQTESGGNPRAVSRTGAAGLMQLMPANVREAGISDPFDPAQNIAAGTEQLAGLLKEYGGDLNLALAGYNAGPGNVRKYGGVPPFRETQDYIHKVRAAMGHGQGGA